MYNIDATKTQQNTLKNVINHALSGDRSAWRQAYDPITRLIRASAWRVARSSGRCTTQTEVEDAVGQVWLALAKDDWRKLRSHDSGKGRSIESWISLIATHVIIDGLRKRSKHSNNISTDDFSIHIGPAHLNPERKAWMRTKIRISKDILTALPDDEREFIIDTVWRSIPTQDIAKRYGIKEKTVYTRKHRISRRLQRLAAAML